MSLTYLSYLKIPELLELQKLRSDTEEHDEMLFIVIHQVYELWFKQILHEISALRASLSTGETWEAARLMRRILTILKVLVHQVDILETMTPLAFSQFRAFLESASGFQSVQFRELEIICGIHGQISLKQHPKDSPQRERLLERMSEETLWEGFCAYLAAKGFDVPPPVRDLSARPIHPPDPAAQSVLVTIMKTKPELALLSELFVDLDEGLQEWRYRHVKMVERTIGAKKGTGGSPGVAYLRSTLHQPIFPDLWAIRNEL